MRKPDESPLELEDLEEALAPLAGADRVLPPAGKLAEALDNSIRADLDLDLRIVDDESLDSDDPVRRTRLVYTMSLLRMWDFLRQPTTDISDKREAAKVAMMYIKHAESTNLEALKFGRAASDDVLKREVAVLREKVKNIAAEKRAALNE